MATVQTLAVVDIPGLYHLPNAKDFVDSRNVYAWLIPRPPCDLYASTNSICSSKGLPQPEDQPDVSETTLKNLGEPFVLHDAYDSFGIYLLYAYFQVPEGNVLYGVQV